MKKTEIRLEHRAFGLGTVIAVRFTDSGGVIDLLFDDGRPRSCLALPEFWLSDPAELQHALSDPPKPKAKKAANTRRPRVRKPDEVPNWRHTFEFTGAEDELAELVAE